MSRHDGYSPHKDVRRSARTRSTVYKSLGENELGLGSQFGVSSNQMINLLVAANDLVDRNRHQQLRHTTGRYPTRSNARFEPDPRFAGVGDSTEDDEEDERRQSLNPRRSNRRNSHVLFDDDDASRDVPDDKSPAPTSARPPKRRRAMMDSEEDEPTSSRAKDVAEDGDMYERVKIRHKDAPSSGEKNGVSMKNSPSSTTRSSRHERRAREAEKAETAAAIEAVEDAEHRDEEEEESDEDEKEPRQYILRERRERKTVERYGSVQNRPKINERRSVRNFHRLDERMELRKKQRDFRRRMARSDSSSTDATDDEAGGSGTKRRGSSRRQGDDDERFEQRKEKSMAKSRQRFLPINISAKDLSSSSNVVRERLRQAGASCSDIDPMTIDNTVLFDQVGGLDNHLQTLKEVVLFPMMYPEIFDRFKIIPPKGCIFYGPPGTGKTLVARALANECAKGAKKVAFFMRKGADCLSKWVGESERQLRLLFDQAYAMRPSIIFFDEIDGLAPVRSSRQDQIHASIVSTLLALMDGLDSRGEVVVIGATNRLDTIDPALRRPGRFDRELKFSLPDSTARRDILEIHTKEWGVCKPAPEVLEWLADGSSGYCGADLKFLCTEAVLIALRERYPHIYMSSERLVLDPNQVVIELRHLQDAMRRITPASRRDLSIPCRPMEPRTSLVLRRTLDQLMNSRIPTGYRQSSGVSQSGIGSSQLEKVVKALESAPVVPAVRLLLTGTSLRSDTGQSSFLLPALLSKLDHLPIFSLAVGKLFADGRPEETLAQTMQSALRAASSTPAILLLPNIDQWYAVVPPSVSHMLATALDNLTGFTSLLLLASCNGTLETAGGETPALRGLFRRANVFEVPVPSDEERRAYMEFITKPTLVPPKKFDPSAYPSPPVATDANVAPRKLSDREITELKKLYEGQEREFRIFLRDILARLMRDRRFHIFNNPVDVEDAEDYYQIIAHPMCLSDMMGKIDRREYRSPDQFVADINLIMSNALEYNPPSSEGRVIRHNAVALRDMCDALLDMELDQKFVEKMQESMSLLKEAGVKIKREQLPFTKTLPQKFTRAAAGAGFVNELEEGEEKKEEEGGEMEEHGDSGEEEEMDHDGPSTSAAGAAHKTPTSNRRKKRRLGTYSLKRNKSSGKKSDRARSHSKTPEEQEKKIAAAAAAAALDDQTAESMDSIDGSSRGRASDESASGDALESRKSSREEMRSSSGTVAAASASASRVSPSVAERESGQSDSSLDKSGEERGKMEGGEEKREEEKEVLRIDEQKMKEVVEKCTSLTRDWPTPELERLAAALIHEIDLKRECWDRRCLPATLLQIAETWRYEDE